MISEFANSVFLYILALDMSCVKIKNHFCYVGENTALTGITDFMLKSSNIKLNDQIKHNGVFMLGGHVFYVIRKNKFDNPVFVPIANMTEIID